MLFTLEQFILLAVVLIAGFLLGFASRPSARKWKRKAAAQSESFTAYHTDAEDRVRAARQRAKALEDEAAALRSDHAEAERTIVALRAERKDMPSAPAESAGPPKTGLGDTTRDDLTRIRGIDRALDIKLFGLGVLRFEDIEQLSDEDEMALEQRLALPAGYVAREQWRAQAAVLRASKGEEDAERFTDPGTET